MRVRGTVLVVQRQVAEGIVQMRQETTSYRATGAELARSLQLAMLADAYGQSREPQQGVVLLDEALHLINKTGERC